MQFIFRQVTIWVIVTTCVAQPVSADLPPFDLQLASDGSLSATMGKDIRVWCDALQGQLVLEYFDEHAASPNADHKLGFLERPFAEPGENAETIEMKVTHVGPTRLVGRTPVNEKLLRVLEEEHMAIIAPNEMGEPLYTGRSEALLTVAKSCAR